MQAPPKTILVLYKITNTKDIYPNAFMYTITNHRMRREEEEVKVKDVKSRFPWGQINKQEDDKVIMRFGLAKNNEGNCDIWIDL